MDFECGIACIYLRGFRGVHHKIYAGNIMCGGGMKGLLETQTMCDITLMRCKLTFTLRVVKGFW